MIASRTLEKTGHSIILLSGWRMQILCISAGALTALGQAPLHLIAFMAISFPVFVFLLDGAVATPGKRGIAALMPAFWRGWLFGFGYFVAGLWWLGSAFLVNADRFAALLPLGVIALPAALAFFYAFAALIARMFWTTGYRRIVVLAASFALIEWLRTFILTGFPWNSLGYLLAINDTLMQAMALTGTHAYTFFAVLIFASPALFGDSPDDHALRQAKRGQRGRATFLSLVVILLCAIVGYGFLRLQNAPPIATLDGETNTTSVEDVVLRVVQPNILQKDKFKPEKAREILDRHLNLSRRITGPEDLGLLQTTHLIWPESAFPFLLTDYPTVLSEIGAMLPPGTTLLTGAVRAEPPAPGEAGRRFFNSLYAIDHTGAIDQAYDKVHLVPFGEYLPFEATLEGLGLLSFVEYPGGFNRGPSKRVLNVAGVPPVLPLICYEVIFPHDFDATKQIASAGWILNVTNDAWFGITSGPYQHFHQTRLRAVDEGLPVVRAANNGISAVIDGYGRVVKKLDLGEAGIIDAKLPERISVPLSDQMRTVIFVIMMITSFGLVFVRR